MENETLTQSIQDVFDDYERNTSYDPYYYLRGHYGKAIADPKELAFW